jgi:hypothetical protein
MRYRRDLMLYPIHKPMNLTFVEKEPGKPTSRTNFGSPKAESEKAR